MTLLIHLQKSRYISEKDSPKQELKHYAYEGEKSVTGSIGNCSFVESNDDLEFLNNLGSKFNNLAEVCEFKLTDPKVIANPVETTSNAAASSSHVTNIIQSSPEEVTVKSPLVQPPPNQEIIIQEPIYSGFNQPMASNDLPSEDGLGQGLYIINGAPEAERILTQGNSYTLAYLGNGQQAVLANNIIGDSVLYSQFGPQSPVMITEGLEEVNSALIQNCSPTPNLVMMPQQQLDGIGSLQMLRVPVESVVSGENGQGRFIFIDGSANEGKVFVESLGPSHHPMNPQILYQVSAQGFSGMVHMNQTIVDGSLSSAQNEGSVTTVESPVNGSNILIGGTGTPNLVTMPQMANGQINSHLFISGPSRSASKEGGESRLLINGHSVLDAAVSGGNLLVAGPGQNSVSMSAGTPNIVRLPQVANGQVLENGLFPSVQNIASGKGGQSRPLVSGPKMIEGSSSMVMMPKSKGLATNGQLNVEQ